MFNFRLLLLLQILLIVKSQYLNPSVRTLHSSILVDKKLYIFGGFKDRNDLIESTYNLNPNDRFFYLDVSKPFDTSTLPWTAVIPERKLYINFYTSSIISGGVAASYGGKNNDTIYFINNEKDEALSPVLTFNTKDNSWNRYPQRNILGERPIGRNQVRPITDYSGKIYLLAGFSFTTLQNVTRDQGGMFIFDTINSNCALKDVIDGMSTVEYSATLLPNGIIVYMGGKGPDGKPATDSLRVVFLYNTNDDSWDQKSTTGDIPNHGDYGISSVLGLDGFRIIVFGGHNIDNKMLYVLDTTTFNWYEPNVSGKGPTMKRFDHTANVIGRYMVIAFGSGPNLNFKYKENGESDVLLLDISDSSNFIWTEHFNPDAVIPPQSSPSQSSSTQSTQYNNKNNTRIIVGVVVGVSGIIFITLISIFFRRKNLLHEKAPSIPSDGGNVMPIPSGLELSSGRNSRISRNS